MKKLFLILSFSLLISEGCKKNDPQPTVVVVNNNPPTAQKWNYEYDYKHPNDPNTYTGQSCLTDDEMTSLITNIGAFNVRKFGKC